jgi:hypothetical protein
MKKIIRLTESDLHNIIKESVNNILSELDWKTYMNAARKRREQTPLSGGRELANYAKEQFRKQHGVDTQSWEDNGKAYGEDGRYVGQLHTDLGMNSGEIRDQRGVNHGFGNSPYGIDTHKFNKDGYQREYRGEKSPELNQASASYRNKLNNMGRDMESYYTGKSQYTKGKGWNS